MADSFQFELVSPERLLLSEQVSAVNVPGTEGYFTVMARHAPLMTSLKPGVVTATMEDGSDRRIFVLGGFADVNDKGLTLLAERATAVEDLDPSDLDQRIQDAQEDVDDAADAELKAKAIMKLSELKDARLAVGA